MWKAFKGGVFDGAKQWKVALIVYNILLFASVTIGLQVYQVLEASIGNSLEIGKLMDGFDNTVFTDFLNVHGASITPLIGQFRYLILIYLIVSIFINSGLLSAIVNKEYTWKAFWRGAAAFFYPFSKIGGVFLTFLLFWTLLLWVPTLVILEHGLEHFSSEVPMIHLTIIVLLIYLLGIVFIFNWSLVSRIQYITQKERVWKTIKTGFIWTKKNYLSSTGLFLLFALFQFIIIAFYFCFGQKVGMTSPFLIFFFLICQQLFIYFRILWRIMLYAGMHKLSASLSGSK